MKSIHEPLMETLHVFHAVIHHEVLENSQGVQEIGAAEIGLLKQAADKLSHDLIGIQSNPVTSIADLTLQHLSYNYLFDFLKPRVQKSKSKELQQTLAEIEIALHGMAVEYKLFGQEDSRHIVDEAARVMEHILQISEYLVRAPKKWGTRWDQRESLDLKISALANELGVYRSRMGGELQNLSESIPSLQKGMYPWPMNREAIMILLQLSVLHSPTGIAAISTDPDFTILLMLEPQVGLEKIEELLNQGSQTLLELNELNKALQDKLKRALNLAESNNHQQAAEVLSEIPPHFQSVKQKQIQEIINKTAQRVNYIKSLYLKTQQKDLQKLNWSDIRNFCANERAILSRTVDAPTDYDKNVTTYVEALEKIIRDRARMRTITMGVVIALLLAVSGGIGYLMHIRAEAQKQFELYVIPSNSKTEWQIFDEDGKSVGDVGFGSKSIKVPRKNYTVRFVSNGKVSLDKVLPYKYNEVKASEETALRNPYVKLLTLDKREIAIGAAPTQQILIDGVPIDPNLSGCHIPKGMRRFSLKQEGLPDYEISHLVSQNETEFSLISPWESVAIETEADDLRASINNGSKRRIPSKIYLPVGTHFIILRDSLNNILMSREFKVEKQIENKITYNTPFSTLTLSTHSNATGIQVLINGQNFGGLPLTAKLVTPTPKVQLLKDGRVIYSFTPELVAGETIEKVIELNE